MVVVDVVVVFVDHSVINLTNILRAVFVPIFFCKKITKPNCSTRKAAQSTFVKKSACKILMKLTPDLGV